MGTNNIIVREYLESLKEDGELDKIFPLLLNLMGFRIIATPKASKGQPQYGKDIIAMGRFGDGIQKRYYFELKGHSDRNIDDTVFSKQDGIRDSLLAAKYASFEDSTIPGFNSLPVKIVLVHNGILKANTRPTFEGFIKKEFPLDDFERWDIDKLTDLFSTYLFGEYLLTDETNIKLFKKTLVLLDVPEYDLKDFKELIIKLLNNEAGVQTRAFSKLFATLNLLSYIVYHYSKEANNILPAKNGISFLILQTWAWILKNKLEKKKAVLREFKKLLKIQYTILNEYLKRILPASYLEDGLCAEQGGPFETVGYPLRAMDFISDIIYYFYLRYHWPIFNGETSKGKKARLEWFHKKALFKILEQNDGCARPVIDSHSIPIVSTVLFVLQSEQMTQNETALLNNYIVSIINNIVLINVHRKRLPEFTNNIEALIEFAASEERPFDYSDSSSMLIMVLFEMLAILNNDTAYKQAREAFGDLVNLQTSYPNLSDPSIDIEQLLFEGNIYDYMYVESSIELPEDITSFKRFIKEKPYEELGFRTDEAGFPFLKLLAIIYYQNDIFPYEWRKYMI